VKFKPEDFKCKDCFGYCSCVQGGEYIARLANARIPFILEEAKKQWMKELLAEAPVVYADKRHAEIQNVWVPSKPGNTHTARLVDIKEIK